MIVSGFLLTGGPFRRDAGATSAGRLEVEALLVACGSWFSDETVGLVLDDSLPRLLPASVLEERLLWITGVGSKKPEFRFGVPSLLGRAGGSALLGDPCVGLAESSGFEKDCGIWLTAVRPSLEALNFCDEVRGGGLGGGGASFNALIFLPLRSSSLTVEFDDEEVVDSRTAASPRGSLRVDSGSLVTLPARRRVTGGRLRVGLVCRPLADDNKRLGAIIPGDCDAIDVGVVFLLYALGPGESENLVDGLALTWLLFPDVKALLGVGGGRFSVDSLKRPSTFS